MTDAGLSPSSGSPAAGEAPPPLAGGAAAAAAGPEVNAPGPVERVPGAPGRPPLYFRDSDRGLPGRPLTESTDFRNPYTFIFPRAVAPYAVVFYALALLARTGDDGPDCAAVPVKELEQILPFSDRWIYRGLNFLAFHGFLFSTPAPAHLAAQGCHRVFRLRVPKPGTVAATPPQARVNSPDRVFDPASQSWGGRRRPDRPGPEAAPTPQAPKAPATGADPAPESAAAAGAGDAAAAPAQAASSDGPTAPAAAGRPAPRRRVINGHRPRYSLGRRIFDPVGPSAKQIAQGVPEGRDYDPGFVDRFSDYVVAALLDELGPVRRVRVVGRVELPQAPDFKTPAGPFTLERSTDFYPRKAFREDIEQQALFVRNRRVSFINYRQRVFADRRPEHHAVFDVTRYNAANGTVTVNPNGTRIPALPHHVAYGNCFHAPGPLCSCFRGARVKLPARASHDVDQRLMASGRHIEKHFSRRNYD